MSNLNWEYHPALKTGMEEQYEKLIISYKALLNKTEVIPYQLTKSNLIRTIAKIFETQIIWQIGNSSWFNRPIINLPTHTRLIIKLFFSNNFWPFLIAMENKIKQLLNRKGLKHEFECFFEKTYKIWATATILGLYRLIYNNPSLDLT